MPRLWSKIQSSKFRISQKTNRYRIPRKPCPGSGCKKGARYTFQLKSDLRYWMIPWLSQFSQLESYISPKFTRKLLKPAKSTHWYLDLAFSQIILRSMKWRPCKISWIHFLWGISRRNVLMFLCKIRMSANIKHDGTTFFEEKKILFWGFCAKREHHYSQICCFEFYEILVWGIFLNFSLSYNSMHKGAVDVDDFWGGMGGGTCFESLRPKGFQIWFSEV